MKTIPVNKWTITATIVTAFLLLGIGGAIAAPDPETKTVTKTEYKTRTVEVEGETKYELSPTCRLALKNTTQTMIDFNSLVGSIANKLVEYSSNPYGTTFDDVLAEQKTVVDSMTSATGQVASCDPSLAGEIDIPE